MLTHFPDFTPRPAQIKACNFVEKALALGYKDIVIEAPTGCHEGRQKVVMYDGTLKRADEVSVGDLLMGPDSKPRTVVNLIRGFGAMYDIIPTKGEKFTVNEDHILALKLTPNRSYISVDNKTVVSTSGIVPIEHVDRCKITSKKTGRALLKMTARRRLTSTKYEVSVKDYVKLNKSVKFLSKLYHAEEIKFSAKKDCLTIPPRILGMWLGDGSKSLPLLSAIEPELLEVWGNWASSIGLYDRKIVRKGRVVGSSIHGRANATNKGQTVPNTAKKLLVDLNLIKNKHIPRRYLVASVQDRLELLAGLIDTDGSHVLGTFSFSNTNELLANQTAFLARSLGMFAWIKSRICTCQTGAKVKCFLVTMWGAHPESVPTLVPHKKSAKRTICKDPSSTGFSVVAAGVGNYFGWTITGDGLYLLDDFTVTHNSGKSLIGATACRFGASEAAAGKFSGGEGGYILVHQKLLQDQLAAELDRFASAGVSARLIKSATEYVCHKKPTKTCAGSIGCPARKDKSCTYRVAKQEFMAAPIAATNYAYYLAEREFVGDLADRRVLVLDEAHGLPNLVVDHVGVSVSEAKLADWSPELAKLLAAVNTGHDFKGFMLEYHPQLKARLEELQAMMAGGEMGQDFEREVSNLQREEFKVAELKVSYDPNNQDWVFWKVADRQGRSIANAKPLTAAGHFNRLFPAAVRIFMSAYPGARPTFCRELGLDQGQVAWLRLSSDFPVERRKVHLMNVCSLAKRNLETALPSAIRSVVAIVKKHANERGVIHTHSYVFTKAVVDGLAAAGLGDRVVSPEKAEDREAALEAHRSRPDSVLVSPSIYEGFDFRGDLARYQIILKCPFASLADARVKVRAEMDSLWYKVEAFKAFLQAAGRGMRAADDWCTTYVIDKDMTRLIEDVRAHAPRWFLEAIHAH